MRAQRLVFGEVAELYDRHRPTYPDRLIDDLLTLARVERGQPVLEVGAGTGKATRLFAARGIPVVAVEPSAEMAAVARRNCRTFAGVEIEQSDFEHWDPAGRRFPLLACAQAWHWVHPAVGYAKARQALLPGGILAAFWNRVAWARCELRESLAVAYQRSAPELAPDSHILHPGNLCPDADADWESAIAAADGLGCPEIHYYEWEQSYSAVGYAGLLATLSDIHLLPQARRTALLDAVTGAIKAHGAPFILPMHTRLCLAHRC